MKKYREFWIQETAYCPIVFYSRADFLSHEIEMHELENRSFCEATHVIEYTSLLESEARCNMLVEALKVCATRKECSSYECCGSCGPIYEAEEALEAYEASLKLEGE